MSLISAMTDMLRNDAAMEAAEDITLFEEEIAMEADELIDIMVDGEYPFEDDPEIDQMEEEDAIEDQINDELDAEDESLAGIGGIDADGDDTVVGQEDSSPDPEGNQTDAKRNTNDPNTTKDGSIGQKNSTPNPAKESMSFFDMIMSDHAAMEGKCCESSDEEEEEEDDDTSKTSTDEYTSAEDELAKMNSSLDDMDDEDFDDED